MFEDLRIRITVMFVALSAVIYISLTWLGLVIFEQSLTASIDKELRVVASEIGHAIDLVDGNPRFRDWKRIVQTEPPRSLATIQLYDRNGKLLEHYGPRGIEELYLDLNELKRHGKSMRIFCSPLFKDGASCGYVQIQISTKERDQVLKDLRLNAIIIGILFLLALSAASYWLARRVTRPIQDSIQILRSFVADAGHELNTPLTILQARTESLERKLSKLSMQEEDLSVAAKSIERLNKVVSDLLLLSEVEDPIKEIKMTKVDISSLLRQIADSMSTRFVEKGIGLKVEVPSGLMVKGNAPALDRLFANLMENALRYTDEGAVTLSAESAEKELRVSVEDTGIGIPEESLPRIFDRFFRVDKSRSRASGGTGLGLAIVKAISEAHHAKIKAESTFGNGSKFTVIFRS